MRGGTEGSPYLEGWEEINVSARKIVFYPRTHCHPRPRFREGKLWRGPRLGSRN